MTVEQLIEKLQNLNTPKASVEILADDSSWSITDMKNNQNNSEIYLVSNDLENHFREIDDYI